MTEDGTGLVVIVDDDPVLRALFSKVLELAGFATIAVSDGESALETVSQHTVTAMLLDGNLPGMSGADVVRAMRSNPATAMVPVVMVTGASEISDRVEGLDAGADDYLVKPVDIDELVARIRAHVRTRMAWGGIAEQNLRRRIAAVQELGQIRATGSAAAIAQNICDVLSGVEGLRGAVVYHLPAPGVASVLGAFGADGVPKRGILPLAAARRLEQRLAGGSAMGDVVITRGEGVSVLVPFGPPELRMGALEVHVEARGNGDVAGYLAMSTAVDLAGMVTALLGPVLAESVERADSAARIASTLSGQGLWTVLQPVAALDTREVVGYEALCRLADGTPPDVFLAEAAHAGMGQEAERAMVANAIEAARSLPEGIWISCNVSPTLALNAVRLDALLAAANRPVVLELTEHERIEDYGALRNALASLSTPVRVAVDDAGAGYASLRHVLELEPSYIKLDKEWVTGIDKDLARQALVGGLATFARTTNCQLIAEGVEIAEELETLLSLGVLLGQGYLLGAPQRPV